MRQRPSLLRLFALSVLVCTCAVHPANAHADDAAAGPLEGPRERQLSAGIVSTPAEQPHISIATPVGRAFIGADDNAEGPARYAARSGGEGSGLVRFTSSRPRIGITASAGSVPEGLPLARGRITSRFGARQNPVTGSYQNHSGLDLAAPAGSPIAATGDGTVSFAGAAGNYGLLVVVDHGNGVQTRYAHMQRIGVGRGQAVKTGDLLGLVGSTGRSTGPHLHYEVRSNGRALNPLAH